MISSLKNHPFKIKAFFKSSVVLTYAVKKEELFNKIPSCLQLDTFNNEWAFIAFAIVQTQGLRPSVFPELLGMNFFLIGYRIFVDYKTSYNKRLRGLYILKSETDKSLMQIAGNFFTHYNYSKTDILFKEENDEIIIQSVKSGLNIQLAKNDNASLPPKSPFFSWKDARRFAGPLPFTFHADLDKKEVLIVEGMRQNWSPRPMQIINSKVRFIDEMNFKTIVLANAFIVEKVNYCWKKGVIDKCNH
ncbi:MAG: DUF2071 domain-containing protein [Parafilimonas sp.]